MISYDPDQHPNVDPVALKKALQLGLTPINITCDEPDRKAGDVGSVSFAAFVTFIPRIGERIVLEDGTTCEVRRVYHKAVNQQQNMISLMSTVYAIRISPDRTD
jgi:hypothetical protein